MSRGHSHSLANFDRAFIIGILLNSGFVAIESVFGFFAHSLALLADAGHNFGDVLGLVMAWTASYLVKRAPTRRHTYGFRASSILAALANAIILLVVTGALSWEAIRRLIHPEPVVGTTMIWVAAVGVVIAVGTWGLLRESLNLSLAAVPTGIDSAAVENYLSKLPGVARVHDLHIWAMSTTEIALTAHLVKPDGKIDDPLLVRIQHQLHDRFGIGHMTIQLECGGPGSLCAQESAHVV